MKLAEVPTEFPSTHLEEQQLAPVPIVALPVPVAITINLPGNWTYAGCLRDQCAAFGNPASGK